jgi:hypothetical protein
MPQENNLCSYVGNIDSVNMLAVRGYELNANTKQKILVNSESNYLYSFSCTKLTESRSSRFAINLTENFNEDFRFRSH